MGGWVRWGLHRMPPVHKLKTCPLLCVRARAVRCPSATTVFPEPSDSVTVTGGTETAARLDAPDADGRAVGQQQLGVV